jgi:hypothetical protein
MFSLQQNRRTRWWNRFCPDWRYWGAWEEGQVAQTMYTYVNKCEGDKIEQRKMKVKKKKEEIVGKGTLDECVPDVFIVFSEGGRKRPWLRRSQVFGILNKELDGNKQIAKQQPSFTESESRKYTP